MLDTARIKEAENNIKSYLAEGLIKKKEIDGNIINVFISNARESLIAADAVKEISDLWTIVCSYYSMYYYANALLLRLGYKVGDKISHKVTSDALIVYARVRLRDSFIEEYEDMKEEALHLAGVKADDLLESFEYERAKRSRIQYSTLETKKHAKALTSLQRSKVFGKELEKFMI